MIQFGQQFSQQSDRSASEQTSIALRSQRPNLWLWLFLVSGSGMLHLLLICWVGAVIQPKLQPDAAPIDLVHLPDPAPAQSRAQSRAQSPARLEVANPTADHTAAQIPLQTAITSTNTQPGSIPVLSSALEQPQRAVAPALSSSLPQRQLAAVFPKPSPTPSPMPQPSPARVSAAPIAPIPSPSPSLSPSPVAPTPAPEAALLPTPTANASAEDLAAAQPITQPITQPIPLPVPDLSQQPNQPSNQQPDELPAAVAIDPIQVPSYLTASLTSSPVAASLADSSLGQPAQPQVEVQRFPTNAQIPPCTVTPEAMYFLGQPVTMRVLTDASGQVVQAITQKSSHNLAYDELATCLVQNWSFQPATAQGQPVADDRLIVQLRVDRN
jgi:TonB family protein